mmetsp:Transcript_10756/g.14954  ORF Transcript_10756/g.14954 Transcript_10756/m.14954 type:complete len:240 (-) Transcript_10756:261-980(-)|eukprot:jgi/Bigna1/90112/estExt_fgenesh1_pg.C_620105
MGNCQGADRVCAVPRQCNHLRYREITNWDAYDDGKAVGQSDPGYLKDQRSRIRAELVSSEEVYTRHLQTFFRNYANPLNKEKNEYAVMKSTEKWGRYFNNLDKLKNFHRDTMVKVLQSAQPDKESDDIVDIGERFLSVAGQLTEIYTPYLRCFTELRESIKAEKKKSKYSKFFKDACKQCNGLEIESYLIMPVQRLPRYKMLIFELMKYTPEDHVERKSLEEAADMIKQILDDCNSKTH